MVIGSNIYISNAGDSRAVGSFKGGRFIKQISRDHKPSDKEEYNRIIKAGGKVYQSVVNGPYRIFPGRLSVSRSIGDAQAKLIQFGGNPGVLISDAEIYKFNNNDDSVDFIVMGSDG